MKVQRSKGMRDLLPADMKMFRLVEKTGRECCLRWGYREVRTPTIEYLYLFTSAGTLTPGMLGKVYSFLDWDGWSGERVVLRPDGTIPVARLYAENLAATGPVRLFYSANIFRFEKEGENPRERWQLGAELIGVSAGTAELELIALVLEIIGKLGLKDVEMRLSHAGLVRTIIDTLGLNHGEQSRLFDRILEGDEAVLNELEGDNRDYQEMLLPLLKLRGRSSDYLREQRDNLVKTRPDITPYLDDFLKIVGRLDALGCQYNVDIASGAGFEYYTGAIFQLYYDGEKIGGGGRYDALVAAMGGDDVPACGFALYLDQVMKLVNPEILPAPEKESVLIKLAADDNETVKKAFGLAAYLREAGYTVAVGQNGVDFRWTALVDKDASAYRIKDIRSGKAVDAVTPAAVLKYLEESGAD